MMKQRRRLKHQREEYCNLHLAQDRPSYGLLQKPPGSKGSLPKPLLEIFAFWDLVDPSLDDGLLKCVPLAREPDHSKKRFGRQKLLTT